MLIEFSAKNFLSFKDKVTLSMEKGNGDEKLENVFTKNDVDLLRTTAIYGANASGKTNILKAFTCAILMIRNSNFMNTTNKWFSIKPFLFDKKLVRNLVNLNLFLLLMMLNIDIYLVQMQIRYMMKF